MEEERDEYGLTKEQQKELTDAILKAIHTHPFMFFLLSIMSIVYDTIRIFWYYIKKLFKRRKRK